MIWPDYVILAVIALSTAISFGRGFVRESVSLAAWIIAFWVGLTYTQRIAALLEGHIDEPVARYAVVFTVLFLAVLILGAVINHIIGSFVRKTAFSSVDRAIGLFFGVARGVVLIAALVLMATLTPFPEEAWWNDSFLIGYFEWLAVQMRGFLPPDVAENLKFGWEQ